MGVSGDLVGYLQGEVDPNSSPGCELHTQGCACTQTIGVHPAGVSGASCNWEGVYSWGLILTRAGDCHTGLSQDVQWMGHPTTDQGALWA